MVSVVRNSFKKITPMPKSILSLWLLVAATSLSATIVPTEIMYNPVDGSEYEFLELYNAGTEPVALGSYSFDGFTYTIPTYSLEPGKYLLLVSNGTAFHSLYQVPDSPYYRPEISAVLIWDLGNLSNGGENLALLDPTATPIFSFVYDDEFGWPTQADGLGSSLELKKPEDYALLDNSEDRNDFLNDPQNWRASAAFQGTPGTHGNAAADSIIINEILANTDTEITDSVELYNPTESTIDLSGWYLSDSSNNYKKYQIPANTVLPPGEYLVYNESHFNPEGEWKNGPTATPGPNDFSLSGNKGDEVYLIQADAQGNLTGIADHVEFGPTLSGESLGRWPNATGDFIKMSSFTQAADNSGPKIGPIILSEIMYHPNTLLDELPLEFIELHNTSDTSQDLSLWTLEDAVDFLFPEGTILPAGGYLLVTAKDPSIPSLIQYVRTAYDLDESLQILGPWAGSLNNTADHVKLYRRDTEGDWLTNPDTLEQAQPLVLEDQVPYQDSGDWPNRADGSGPSLSRKSYSTLATDPDNWRSSNEFKGNPGEIGLPQRIITINEILSHTDPPLYDTIELYNPGNTTIDLSGWYLSDTDEGEIDIELFRKYRIPDGTTLGPGEYITFNQLQFNPNIDPETDEGNPEPHHFGLSSAFREDIALVSADAEGNLLRIVDHVEVGPTANGISHGLWPDTEGNFYAMSQRTLGSPNASPRVGPLIFTEIHYNPGEMENASDLEFLEIYNVGTSTLRLDQDYVTGGIWGISGGVDIQFLNSVTIAPEQVIVIVGFDPSDTTKLQAFIQQYSLTEIPKIVGPWSGSLSNGGETISIQQPDTIQATKDGLSTFYPMVKVEIIDYGDSEGWPQEADGEGASLQRISLTDWADAPEAWKASETAPSPGTVEQTLPQPPAITSSPLTIAFEGEVYTYLIQASDSDSPTPPTLVINPQVNWLNFTDYGNGTAILTGTPTSADIGIHILTATATSQGESVEQAFPIQVYDAQQDSDDDGAPDGIEYRLGTNRIDPNSTPARVSHTANLLSDSGWMEVSWLGIYMDQHNGWIYHSSLGWLYVSPLVAEEGFWIWDTQLNWLWTREDMSPYFYSQDSGWLYYHLNSSNPRYFFNYSQDAWTQW